MSKVYINSLFCDTKDELIEKTQEVVSIKNKLWLTGKSKDYINRKRYISCNNRHCHLCSQSKPYNRSIKKGKGNKKRLARAIYDYNLDY